jgi:hypothetical protein
MCIYLNAAKKDGKKAEHLSAFAAMGFILYSIASRIPRLYVPCQLKATL